MKACQGPILRRKATGFCAEHSHLSKLCRVDGCSAKLRSQTNALTCENAEHIAFENEYYRRVRKRKRHDDDDAAETLKRKIPAQFGCRYTPHLLVSVLCCGIIVSVEKLVEDESVSNVAEWLQASFDFNDLGITHIFYDNACNLLRHIMKREKFSNLRGMEYCVDRFHFRGHNGNVFCRTHCNPDARPELFDSKGNPMFNTSICESTNSWLRRIAGTLRQADADFADFWLYTALHFRNSQTMESLSRRGQLDVEMS